MLFYLITLNIVKYLMVDAPMSNNESNAQTLIVVEAQKNSDYLCRSYVINNLTNSLSNMYSSKKTTKELWQSFDQKYKFKDASAKKFVVGRFLTDNMVNLKTIIS